MPRDRIDHDRVRYLHKQGLTNRQISDRLGCSIKSIPIILNPDIAEKQNAAARVRRRKQREAASSSNGRALA